MGEQATRVDLGALREMRDRGMGPTGVLRDAIAELEAARAAPPSPPVEIRFPEQSSAYAFVRSIAEDILKAMARRHEAGPARAARLVAYRCAERIACPGVANVEDAAHAMLAAEREPS